MTLRSSGKLNIAVVGSGISGLSAAWLLSQSHTVTLYEKDDRPGGHSNTVDAGQTPVDTGFIVYNTRCYPNLCALFDHLGVQTAATDMSFAASMDRGGLEYGGSDLASLIAQKRNIFRPRFWRMVRDILRFYREAPLALETGQAETQSLGDYLTANRYSKSFINDHLLPMGAAIWSTPVDTMMEYPLAAFVRFCQNHGLLQIKDRPQWRTVVGGSRQYVSKMIKDISGGVILDSAITQVGPNGKGGVFIEDRYGERTDYDHVVLACHGDQALSLQANPAPAVRDLLSAFQYERNLAILHDDDSLMPRTRKVWSSWNYLAEEHDGEQKVCVTYWMNRLQHLDEGQPLFVTLNPARPPREGSVIRSFLYDHPVFDAAAMDAQKRLWSIQGQDNIWYCGSYFGYGFHEDGIQSGLAVAEALGNVRRPWNVENESGRIHLGPINIAQKEAAE
ncbi:NADH-ubiquinone oxidoreductase subunit 6 [Thalassospira lucentensis]|uniref:NADH-ubiquinone oxidoreductase subunit 6 n=1 Tax=Thalassospira lucentensis TaxID=168935 RepID=A0A154L181_9PROT|nr:FAD-dependent oxidoreductase [Thalassospira lucentensis]KZB61582.1 NADH-ubiquinone oxidoreductase subunit 6 [Thalassospira lucentensis]